MNDRRLGKFYFIGSLVEEDIKAVARVFSLLEFVPHRVEHLYYKDMFEYIGHSPQFREVPVGTKVPTYEIIVESNTTEEGVTSVTSVTAVEGKS